MMSVSTTVFTSTDANQNASDLYDWMLTNASEYFDEITFSSPLITCKVGDTDFLKISTNNSQEMGITLPNGNGNMQTRPTAICRTAYKTSSGLALFMDNSTSIFVTKSDSGATCAVSVGLWGFRKYRIIGADVESSTGLTQYPRTSEENFEYFSNLCDRSFTNAGKAALVPFTFDNGSYTPDLFLVPFSPFVGTRALLDLDGTKYVYDGCIALKE